MSLRRNHCIVVGTCDVSQAVGLLHQLTPFSLVILLTSPLLAMLVFPSPFGEGRENVGINARHFADVRKG